MLIVGNGLSSCRTVHLVQQRHLATFDSQPQHSAHHISCASSTSRAPKRATNQDDYEEYEEVRVMMRSGRSTESRTVGFSAGIALALPTLVALIEKSICQRISHGKTTRIRKGQPPNHRNQTAKLPDVFLWMAVGSMAVSATMQMMGNSTCLFVGQWAPTFLIRGI